MAKHQLREQARRGGVAVALATLALPALATGVQTLETVEVRDAGQASELGVADAPSQGTVRGPRLHARPAFRPGELLESMPGLVVTQHSGEGKANQYFLRGFNLDHGTDLAIHVDGMPVNMRTHGHGQGYADLAFLIPELVDRVEYRKGPYHAEDGDFASAGAARLSLVNRLAGNTAVGTVGGLGHRRALLAGSPDDPATNLVYALDVMQHDGPWRNADDLGRVNALFRIGQGSEANGFNVTLMGYRGRWNATDQIPRRAVEAGTLGRFDAVDPTSGGRAQRASLSGEWRRTTAGGVTRVSAYGIHSRLGLYSNFTYFLNDPIAGDQFEQTDHRAVGGFDASHTWLATWRGLPVENTLGLQTRMDRIRVGLHDTVERSRTSVTREDRVTETSAGAFAQNRLAWTDWLRTVAALRIDQYRGTVRSDRDANGGEASGSIASPKASVVLGPWAGSELYLNWGRGFHSNDVRGATITVDPVTGGPAARVPLLVRSQGSEAGVRTEAMRDLTLTAALFRLDLASELVFVGDAGTTEASRASRRDGVEVTARWSPRPWLLLDLDYAQTKARFRDDDPAGRFIPGAPDRVISAKVIVDRLGPWSGALALRHFGARPLIEDGNVRSPATTLLSGKIGYRLDRRWRVELAGFNLADRKASQVDYFYASRLRGEAEPVDDRHFHPVEPRSFRFSVIASF